MEQKNLKNITEEYIKKVKEIASITKTENLKSIIEDLEKNPNEFEWNDVRIVHKIFSEEYNLRSQ